MAGAGFFSFFFFFFLVSEDSGKLSLFCNYSTLSTLVAWAATSVLGGSER
jgi:hypothetical protein